MTMMGVERAITKAVDRASTEVYSCTRLSDAGLPIGGVIFRHMFPGIYSTEDIWDISVVIEVVTRDLR